MALCMAGILVCGTGDWTPSVGCLAGRQGVWARYLGGVRLQRSRGLPSCAAGVTTHASLLPDREPSSRPRSYTDLSLAWLPCWDAGLYILPKVPECSCSSVGDAGVAVQVLGMGDAIVVNRDALSQKLLGTSTIQRTLTDEAQLLVTFNGHTYTPATWFPASSLGVALQEVVARPSSACCCLMRPSTSSTPDTSGSTPPLEAHGPSSRQRHVSRRVMPATGRHATRSRTPVPVPNGSKPHTSTAPGERFLCIAHVRHEQQQVTPIIQMLNVIVLARQTPPRQREPYLA